MRIYPKYFLRYIRAIYHIDGIIAHDVYFHINIIKCTHGLKQAAIIDHMQLIFHMDPHGYYPVLFIT